MERSSVTPGIAGLKALSHPGRLRILGLLRSEGPATATTLAARLGLNTGATSYHLRQLERHGFVEEDAERGNARDRWWRAVHQMTRTGDEEFTTPEEHETFDAYLQAVAVIQHERLLRSLEERRLLPEPWRAASDQSDWSLQLTPEHALGLVEAIHRLVDEYAEDEDDPGAAPFVLNLNAFVRPGVIEPEEPS